MADEIEDYWDGIRPPRPQPSAAAPEEMKKVIVKEYEEPISYTQSELEAGLRAVSRYRTQLSQGRELDTTEAELDELERTIRRGLGVPDSVPSMTPADAMESWMNTPAARAAFGLPSDSQQRHPTLLNLERAFEALGFRCEVWVEHHSRLHVALTDLSGNNWAAQQLTMGGMQLVLDLHR